MINYFKYKNKTSKSQTNFDLQLIPIKEFCDNPSLFLDSLSASHIKVFDIIIRFSHYYKTIYPSQTTIAQEVGLSRVHVNRIIRDLVSYGFIAKKRRYNATSYYQVSPYFTFADIRQKLSKFFKSLYALPLALLLSFTPNVTLTNIKDIRNMFYKSHHQRRRVMVNEHILIPKYVLELKLDGIELSREQKIKLCAFNKQTISAAIDKFKNAKDVRNPYNYFFKLCLDYADLHDEPINFAYVSRVGQQVPLNDFPSMQKKSQQGEVMESSSSYKPKKYGPYSPWKGFSTRSYSVRETILETEKQKAFAHMLQSYGWNDNKKEQETSNDGQEICSTRGTVFNNQTSQRGASGVG